MGSVDNETGLGVATKEKAKPKRAAPEYNQAKVDEVIAILHKVAEEVVERDLSSAQITLSGDDILILHAYLQGIR